MIFSILVGLMVVLIAAFWVYQGLFSSVLMFFETLIACLLAFGFYEALNSVWVDSIGEGVGDGLAFMGIFVVSLVLMRLATDRLIPGNVKVPLPVDRVGGGIFGFFTGMMLIGSALIAIQMMPIGAAPFGFERFTVDIDGLPVERNFVLKPDRFTVGVANMFSNGRFGQDWGARGERPFAKAKPNFVLDLYGGRAGPQIGARVYVPKDSLEVLAWWTARQIDHATHKLMDKDLERRYSTHGPAREGDKFLVFRIHVRSTAAPQDRIGEIRFRPSQFRIVGPPPKADANVTPDLYIACGLSDLYLNRNHNLNSLQSGQAARLVRFNPTTDFILSSNHTLAVAKRDSSGSPQAYEFDVAFEVPENFEPWYIEFKRGARFDLSANKKQLFKEEPPDYASVSRAEQDSGGIAKAEADQSGRVGEGPRGRTHLATAIQERTGAFAELPVALPSGDNLVAQAIRSGRFSEGQIAITLNEGNIDTGDVTEFAVPSGKRVFQVGAERMEAQSVLGRALSFAARVTAQVTIEDDQGKVYYALGQYGFAKIGDEMVFEIQYHPDAEIPERCLAGPKRVTYQAWQNTPPDERKWGFIFVVDPGVKIVRFKAGRETQEFPTPFDVP